ncbi:MAG TPA: hypothetical protein VJT74_14360 [Pyrinomonadaceae bacterium]|nr:hypothetical protein [Pyrinomonadaceae bacterium]
MNSPKRAAAGRLFFIFVLAALVCSQAYANAQALSEKDIRRGEEIVAALRRMERATDFQSYTALAQKLYPGLFAKVSELREGDLKTDLTTAVFLYEQALSEWKRHPAAAFDCASELREVYVRVCAEEKSATAVEFLRTKARLHTLWAAALIRFHKGGADAATTAALEEMRAERRRDLSLAEEALAALKTLEREVHVYPSPAQFQERAALAKVSFEQLSEDAASALQKVDRILQSLPRGPLFYPLYHARNFYSDGLFWWRKTYRRKAMVVDANSFTEPTAAESFDPQTVDYTVAVNWRNAARRLLRAEQLIVAAKMR